MGRISQMIHFLNAEKFSKDATIYTHFYIDDVAKDIRKAYRKELKKENKTKK